MQYLVFVFDKKVLYLSIGGTVGYFVRESYSLRNERKQAQKQGERIGRTLVGRFNSIHCDVLLYIM